MLRYLRTRHEAPTGDSARAVAIVACTGLVFLVLPRWVGWSGYHIHKEDGSIFLADFAWRGWGSLFDVYSGYLHVGARLTIGSCSSVLPLGWLASCVNVSTAIFRVLCFVVVVPVASAMARSTGWGIAAASTFLFMPVGQHEVLGNVTNMRWFFTALAVWLAFSNFRSVTFAVVGAVLGAIAAMTDPLVLVVAVLAIVRVVFGVGWGRLPAAGLLAGASVQLTALDVGSRTGSSGLATLLADPAGSLVQLAVRGPVVSTYGMTGTQLLFKVGGLGLAAAAVLLPIVVWGTAWSRARRWPVEVASSVVLALAGIALLAATLTFAEPSGVAFSDWWSVANASRYSAMAGLLLIPSLVLSVRVLVSDGAWRRLVGWAFVSLLVVSVLGDFRGDPWSVRGPGWVDTVVDAKVRCIDRGTARVQFTPTDVPMDWSADLPCSWIVPGMG